MNTKKLIDLYNDVTEKLEEAKVKEATLTERLASTKKSLKELKAKMKELGVTPETIDKKLKETEQELLSASSELEKLLESVDEVLDA